ncbi:DUF6268 family outer membrane beta-barrel protein [Ohtaekwangia koreensis]|uniref:DUF6268 domain-containing protein n=1 Tax=Ohtaekwangia koreensis TaxID=688867 RepID=A0A1T5KTA4_9BACT|nr:DUF6268 family outer membrane beta-barrel protein [Ohtaekwangia koreensis]SKC66478.1 hypothetical protein SAMN05660236_2544 [Ohtaekwangia koreensis]
MNSLPGSQIVLVSLLSILLAAPGVQAQDLKPGLPGMAPSKWITVKHTQAPDRIFRTDNSKRQSYTQEDVFFKLWIPLVMKSRFSVIAGPQYRTEQLEFTGSGENPMKELGNWNLRSMGIDFKSLINLDSTSWLLVNLNANQCSNMNDVVSQAVPLNFTLTSLFLRKRSANKEIGFGLMVNNLFHRFTFMPVMAFNYNFSKTSGLEMCLPQKISWRNNLSATDILYVKAEAMTRSYYIKYDDKDSTPFRRAEVDFGVAYNKQINRVMGVEVFGGYRKNISCRLPDDIFAVKTSGAVFTCEFYIRPPRL